MFSLNKMYLKKHSIRTILLILVYNLLNKHVMSYIYGTMKSSLYKIIASTSEDESCILSNPFFKHELPNERCISCESIGNINRIHETFYDEIEIVYARRNKPVIVTDAMYNWKTKTGPIDINNVTDVHLTQSWFYDYIPCKMSTNFDSKINYLIDYFHTIANPLTDNWFINWKNCELKAAKIGRNFYEQPYFLKYYVPAAQVNWILMSLEYSTQNKKELSIAYGKLVVVMQLRGSSEISLIPRKHCDLKCSTINETLHEREILVLNSNIWQIYHSPMNGLGLTIITENEFQ